MEAIPPRTVFPFSHPATATGKGYEGLAIPEGGAASREFLRVTFSDVPEAERQQVRKHLEEYCGEDTEGMIWITDSLRRIT